MLNRSVDRVVTFDEFIEAAKNGGDTGLAMANRYIQQNCDNVTAINATDAYHKTALIYATENNHTAIVTALLSIEGIPVNAVNLFGDTALIWAANKGHSAIVTILLAKNDIAINAANVFGFTALIWAAHRGHDDITTALLTKEGIAINAVTQSGDTALTWAAHQGNITIVTALLAKDGIAINTANQDGNTALIAAAIKGHAAIVSALLAKEDIAINATTPLRFTALIAAATEGHIAVVTALLTHAGVAIDAANHEGNTALIAAAIGGHTTIVIDLLPRLHLIHISHQNNNHLTALEEAERCGHYDIAALIMAREQALLADFANSVKPVSFTPQQRLERIQFAGEVPSELVCPIAQDGHLMIDPITVKSGKTFERANLRTWCSMTLHVETRTFPCPLTRELIHEKELSNKPTTLVKNAIDNFVTAEERKDMNEKKDIKNVMDVLVEKIDATFEMNSVVNNQSSSSSSSSSVQQLHDTNKIRMARQRLTFFESARREKENDNDVVALSSDYNMLNNR